MQERLPLGNSDFKDVITSGCYYVDKTLLIKEILDSKSKLTLIPRPRRFGKSLNMSMLRYFFEKTEESHAALFENLQIAKQDGNYMDEQGKFPVIFITLKNTKYATWEATYEGLKEVIQKEFRRHRYLVDSDSIVVEDKQYMLKILCGEASQTQYESALLRLTNMLEKHHKERVVILIDEYDVPIQSGFENGFFSQIHTFLSAWLSAGLKDNRNMQFAVITGMISVEKDPVFGQMNNLNVATFLDKKYNTFFGFTKEEMEGLTEHFACKDKLEELTQWYGGYQFGEVEIYNPWSVINYFDKDMTTKVYIPVENPIAEYYKLEEENVSKISDGNVIGQCLSKADDKMKEDFIKMFAGESVEVLVTPDIVYSDVLKNAEKMYSYLLMAGYLKAQKVEYEEDQLFCQLGFVNKEIMYLYRREIIGQLNGWITDTYAAKLGRAFRQNDEEKAKEYLSDLIYKLVNNMSRNGKFYHHLMLMLSAVFADTHTICSYRDEGVGVEKGSIGKWDLVFEPKKPEYAGIILKLKLVDSDENGMQKAAQSALNTESEVDYAAKLKNLGVEKIYQYGVGVPVYKN